MLTYMLALGLATSPRPLSPPISHEPALTWIDVGQGNALLIREPEGGVILIDSGPSAGAEAVLQALDGDLEIDLWVHTHWDADHVGGFARAMAGVDGAWPSADDLRVVRAWDRGWSAAPITDAVLLYALLIGDRREEVGGGARITIGQARIESLAITRPDVTEENARGLALCIDLPGLRLLAPGDLPATSVEEAARACPNAHVLWASHHGSADGISPTIVELVDPALVVVSAGPQNPYCHPHPSALGALHDHEVWITHAAGLAATGPCEPIAASLAPKHHIAGGGIRLPLDAR